MTTLMPADFKRNMQLAKTGARGVGADLQRVSASGMGPNPSTEAEGPKKLLMTGRQ